MFTVNLRFETKNYAVFGVNIWTCSQKNAIARSKNNPTEVETKL